MKVFLTEKTMNRSLYLLKAVTRLRISHALLIAMLVTPANAAPSDFDGDGKTDFAVARLSFSDACSGPQTPSWLNCSDGTLTNSVTWFTLRSRTGTSEIQSTSAAILDGSQAYFLDPTLASDYSSGASTHRLVRQDIYNLIEADDIGRIGDRTDYCEASPGVCSWQGGRDVESSLTVSALVAHTASSFDAAIELPSQFARLDFQGEKFLSVIHVNNQVVFAPHRSVTLPANRLSLYFPEGVAVVADYDGDGLDELATWGFDDAVWTIRSYGSTSEQRIQWGLPGDHPMPGDYDGDGKADLAVWRPSTGIWHIITSSSGLNKAEALTIQFGLPRVLDIRQGDKPVRADFDGDGKLDLAVFRPSNGTWFYRASSTGVISAVQWGLPDDLPIGMGPYDRYLRSFK